MGVVFYFWEDLPIVLLAVPDEDAIGLFGLGQSAGVGYNSEGVVWVAHFELHLLFLTVKANAIGSGLSAQLEQDNKAAMILRHGPHAKINLATFFAIQHGLEVMLDILNGHFVIVVDPNHGNGRLIGSVGVDLGEILPQVPQLVAEDELSRSVLPPLYRFHDGLVGGDVILLLQEILQPRVVAELYYGPIPLDIELHQQLFLLLAQLLGGAWVLLLPGLRVFLLRHQFQRTCVFVIGCLGLPHPCICLPEY